MKCAYMRAFNSNFREAVCPGAQGRRSGGGGGRKDASCPHPSHRNSSGHAFYSGNRKRNCFMHAHTKQSYCTLMHAHTDCKILPHAKKNVSRTRSNQTPTVSCVHTHHKNLPVHPPRQHAHTHTRKHAHTCTHIHTRTHSRQQHTHRHQN